MVALLTPHRSWHAANRVDARVSFSSHRSDQVRYTHHVHQADQAPAIRPAGWLASSLLFGIPALTFAFLFHWAGPSLLRQMSSWWRIFHLLLILPLALMLIASLVGAAIDVRSTSWKALIERLRLSAPNATAWIWAAALSGFMYGGNWEDLFALAASWLALWKENNRQVWVFGAILIGIVLRRSASILQPALQSVRFFDASGFHHEFFDRFGPKDFMGIPLHGAWWIVVYYAGVILVCNIGGEELWWRGYVLPRQELAFGRSAWVIHGTLGLPLVYAGDSLGHSPHGNHRYRALLCCAAHKKHMAGHLRPQLRKSGLLSKLG